MGVPLSGNRKRRKESYSVALRQRKVANIVDESGDFMALSCFGLSVARSGSCLSAKILIIVPCRVQARRGLNRKRRCSIIPPATRGLPTCLSTHPIKCVF
jgi:hypothetical protein